MDYLSVSVIEKLCLRACSQVRAFAGRDENIAVLFENYAATKVHAVIKIGNSSEDYLKVFDLVSSGESFPFQLL